MAPMYPASCRPVPDSLSLAVPAVSSFDDWDGDDRVIRHDKYLVAYLHIGLGHAGEFSERRQDTDAFSEPETWKARVLPSNARECNGWVNVPT
jgi:hypothetical protein